LKEKRYTEFPQSIGMLSRRKPFYHEGRFTKEVLFKHFLSNA
jgi:hypothetical protein